MFTGCGTAMVTPFQRDGSLDEPTLRSLIQRQIDESVDFLVPCGTTGESPTLTREEHLRVVEITVEVAAQRVPVLAGGRGYNNRGGDAVGEVVAAGGGGAGLGGSAAANERSERDELQSAIAARR